MGQRPRPEPVVAYYSTEQADRGQRVFSTVCSGCHSPNEFRGPIFGLTWRVEPVGNLFEHITSTMPQDAPGSLTAEEYTDVLAYFLRLNGSPPSERELRADGDLLATMEW